MTNGYRTEKLNEARAVNGRADWHNGQPPDHDAAQRSAPQRSAPVDPIAEPDFLLNRSTERGLAHASNTQDGTSPAQPDSTNNSAQSSEHYASRSPRYAPSPEESTVREPERISRSLRLQWRYWRTIVFFGLLFLRLIFWQVYMARAFPGLVENTNASRWRRYAREFRGFAAKMGGVFIKLGQFVSTRVDILPEEIISELSSLQDEVPTINFKHIRSVLDAELGDIDQYYRWIDKEPIAAASLGQVHRALLHNGDRVIVKVQRPGIRDTCYTDLAAMRVIAGIAKRFRFINRRADAPALVEEFGKVLLEELSYKHEAYNAACFADMFRDNVGVYIPAVYHNLSTDRVLTMEDVSSIKITDYDAIDQAGINRKAVAKRLMETYLDQIFNHYFFHADPHPGNLFIYPLPVENEADALGPEGRPFYLIFVDFGMTGTLTKEIADGMVSTLYSVLTRDAEGLVQSYRKLGFILPGADTDRIVAATNAAFDQVWGLSMEEIRSVDYTQVMDLADEVGELLLSMPFYIPQDFIYLGRTISILSGMSTSLDPHYNPWLELEPYTEDLIARGFGMDIVNRNNRLSTPNMRLGSTFVQSLFNGSGGEVLRTLFDEAMRRSFKPLYRADNTIKQLQKGEIEVTAELSLAHRQQLRRLERETKAVSRSVFFGSVLITSTIFYVNGDVVLAVAGYVLCGLTYIIGTFRE